MNNNTNNKYMIISIIPKELADALPLRPIPIALALALLHVYIYIYISVYIYIYIYLFVFIHTCLGVPHTAAKLLATQNVRLRERPSVKNQTLRESAR